MTPRGYEKMAKFINDYKNCIVEKEEYISNKNNLFPYIF